MLKAIKTLLKDNLLIISITITIAIIYLSLFKVPKTSINISNIDKFYHLIAYFTLAFFWLLTFYNNPNRKKIIVIGCILFGIIIEVIQGILTQYRTADYLDAIANSIGVLLALLIFELFFNKKVIN